MSPTMQVELVTTEGSVLTQEADFVKAPGLAGELGILPRHIALLTPLRPGEVLVRHGNDEQYLFVSSGFLEVLPNRVVILADAAEHAEDIDQARAEAARRRAEELMSAKHDAADSAMAAAALERAVGRLRVAELRSRKRKQPKAQI